VTAPFTINICNLPTLVNICMKVAVNDQEYQVQKRGDKLLLNEQEVAFTCRKVSSYLYHIIYKGKSYEVLIDPSSTAQSITLQIEGNTLHAKLTSDLELMLHEMGYENSKSLKSGPLKAPMPGLILDVLVDEGDEVEEGDPLIILEAMKMENLIKASSKAVIKKIEVKKGESVEKNQALISF